MKLSDTARALLTLAARRNGHLIRPPQLAIAAARQVVRSLLNGGLAVEVTAPVEDAKYVWRESENDRVLMLRASILGLSLSTRLRPAAAADHGRDGPA
jgi:hypothetical protein